MTEIHHSLPHRCNPSLRKLVIMELERQSRPVYKREHQKTLGEEQVREIFNKEFKELTK